MNSKILDEKIKEIENNISNGNKWTAHDQIKELNSKLEPYISKDIKNMSDEELIKQLIKHSKKMGITFEDIDNMSFEELDKLIKNKYNS
jgi:hypothetical protein